MKPEHLESLLLDRALGELSPAVADLLEAHLARDPEAARRAADFDVTVGAARQALHSTPAVAPPPFDRARFERAGSGNRLIGRRTELLRLAACLAVGLGAGWLLRQPEPISLHATRVAVVHPPVNSSTTPFWSISRFAPETLPLARETQP
ncbi:MAG: hypothetical protein JNN01_01510 [Opitutaceae bacterium]|nr:hypothetical protein [Opitutaceae bacterium]